MILDTEEDDCGIVEDLKRRIEYNISKSSEDSIINVSSELFEETLKLRGEGKISTLKDFVSLIALIDRLVHEKFGRDYSSPGEYSGFYLCACARLGLIGGICGVEISSCGGCPFLVGCGNLLENSSPGEELESVFQVS